MLRSLQWRMALRLSALRQKAMTSTEVGMSEYVRYRVPGGCYFFTVNLLERRRYLLTEHIDLLREAFRRTMEKTHFHIDAIVILPEHIHCIWTLPPGDDDFSGRWRAIKKHFSKNLPKTERLSATRRRRHERGIWQRRFWEHVIRDERDYENHANYIHYNPVKHGWVTRCRDWPHSTFQRFVARGVYPMDWGDEVMEFDGDFGEFSPTSP
jgi:putative transposase